jgi:hypothetical protein
MILMVIDESNYVSLGIPSISLQKEPISPSLLEKIYISNCIDALKVEKGEMAKNILLASKKERLNVLISLQIFPKYLFISKLFILSDSSRNRMGARIIKILKTIYKVPILIEFNDREALPSTNLTRKFYENHGFIKVYGLTKASGEKADDRSFLKFYPKHNLEIKIKRDKNIDYLCIGDVIYGLKKSSEKFIDTVYKGDDLKMSEHEARELLKLLNKKEYLKPLAEYPFNDVMVIDG